MLTSTATISSQNAIDFSTLNDPIHCPIDFHSDCDFCSCPSHCVNSSSPILIWIVKISPFQHPSFQHPRLLSSPLLPPHSPTLPPHQLAPAASHVSPASYARQR